ncbi:MAG TPA: YncE family protein [Terracidiphilus sp.]|jgi:YVTN family beta-propeller protein|nr:YncE family protein [Terracidiphilus sp.]
MKISAYRAVLFLLGLCFVSGTLYAQSDASGTLLVLSKHDLALSIVDPSNLQVVARVPVGHDPHEVIASSDGRTAYVSNYGFGAYHTLAVVDLVDHKALPSIDLGALRGPHGLTFVGGKTWFTAEGAKAIGRYDPATGKIDLILGTGQNRTHMIWVSADEQHIVTTNVSSGTVSMIDWVAVHMPGPPPSMGPPPGMQRGPGMPPPGPRMDWNETVVRVGNGSEGFDVSPNGKEVWVANAQDGTISVIDFHAEKVVETIAANIRGANRLKFTPDGTRVLVSSGPDLVVLNAGTRKVVRRIAIGHGSGGVLVQPDGARAFVSCGPDNYVAVVDLHSWKVIGHIDAGGEPDGLAWAVRR